MRTDKEIKEENEAECRRLLNLGLAWPRIVIKTVDLNEGGFRRNWFETFKPVNAKVIGFEWSF